MATLPWLIGVHGASIVLAFVVGCIAGWLSDWRIERAPE